MFLLLNVVSLTGAAFSANITGGISTSVAVFCHELPHELGKCTIPSPRRASEPSIVTNNIHYFANTHFTIDSKAWIIIPSPRTMCWAMERMHSVYYLLNRH